MEFNFISKPWWLSLGNAPDEIYGDNIKAENFNQFLEENVGKSDTWNYVENDTDGFTYLIQNKACRKRGSLFENEHRYVFPDEKFLGAIYNISPALFLNDVVGNMSLKIDEHIKKVILCIGNKILWETIPNEEDYKKGTLKLGEDLWIPLRSVPYSQVSVVIVTDHTNRNTLYDSKYELQMDYVGLPHEVSKDVKYRHGGKVWEVEGCKIMDSQLYK